MTDYQVLIVEDNEELAALLKATLKRRGLLYHHCDNGNDALAFLQQHGVQLVLLDIAMPGMNGWDLLDSIRQDAKLKDVQVMVMTAFDPDVTRRAQHYSVEGYLPKPFRPTELLQKVSDLLQLTG